MSTSRDVIRQAIETSQPAINAGQHMMTISLADQPLTVDGDPVRLTQVFANLLNNAAKYTPPEGRIEISMKRDGDEAVVSIRDNGIGITAEMLPRNIRPLLFKQAATKGREQGGMGIGLALARSLVEMHGGQVEARSDGPGWGSEFVVRLPLLPPLRKIERIEGETTVASIPASHRVLVVDDDRDVADTLVMLLQSMGATFASPIAARRRLRPSLNSSPNWRLWTSACLAWTVMKRRAKFANSQKGKTSFLSP